MEFLEQTVALAIQCGMTADEYWNGDPSYLTDYYRAWEKSEQRKMSDMDTQAWLDGMYATEAHTITLANAFSKKGAKKLEYCESPVYVKSLADERTRKRMEAREREKNLREMERRFAKMAALVSIER